jgi:6-phosphofructokinase 2
MKRILTLTVNPALDKSTSVSGVVPYKKLRCEVPIYEPGGGGINVSRAIKKLGGSSISIYLSGGPTGAYMKTLLDMEGIVQKIRVIQEWTRENLAVTDTINEQQFRFGMPGPKVQDAEWQGVLKELQLLLREDDYLVASGSLALNIPDDFYARVAKIVRDNKAKLVLDTSGEALDKGAKAGVFLLKPNLGELSSLCGVSSITTQNLEPLALKFLKEHNCTAMVVSMGPKGAMLVTAKGIEHILAPTVHHVSSIGAGDSMVAGMVLRLANGDSFRNMAKYGVACGSAATMTPGTQLCVKEDVDGLYHWMTTQKTIF